MRYDSDNKPIFGSDSPFTPGAPCVHGHIGKRSAETGQCTECTKLAARKRGR